MDTNQLQSYLLTLEDVPLDFRRDPLWDWQMGLPIEGDVIEAIPLMQSYYSSDSLFPLQGLTHEINSMFDGEIGLWNDKRYDVSSSIEPERSLICGERREECDQQSREKKVGERCRDQEKALAFEEVSRYFYMPIRQAAKELQVGLTLLKKRCRELGIPRWPHRKMKSLQTLINNVHESVKHEGEEEEELWSTIGLLEQERMMMEKEPSIQLEEKTKRLRQACFKANYKKRRLMALQGPPNPRSPSSLCLLEGNHQRDSKKQCIVNQTDMTGWPL